MKHSLETIKKAFASSKEEVAKAAEYRFNVGDAIVDGDGDVNVNRCGVYHWLTDEQAEQLAEYIEDETGQDLIEWAMTN